MPESRSAGQAFTVKRLSRDSLLFRYRHGGKRIRRVVDLSALTAFLDSRAEGDSNLPANAAATRFSEFSLKVYLPYSAKPRLGGNPVSLESEEWLLRSLCELLGTKSLHEIRPPDQEMLKETWLRKRHANSTIKKKLNCLHRVMDCALSRGLIRQNLLPPAKGLPVRSRASIWLRLPEIDKLLGCCHPTIRPLIEFLILTGARVGEALDFRVGDVRDGKLFLPTEKRRRPARDALRHFDITSLGPRFPRLMAQLTPHPKSGLYFYAEKKPGKKKKGVALSKPYANALFTKARKKAGLDHIHIHDLRGTFCQHRAIVVPGFRQLLYEMGHGDPRSIQSYLDRAQHLEVKESIFYNPPKPEERPEHSIVLVPEPPLPPTIHEGESRSDTLLH